MCDCFHLAFPNWHAPAAGAGRRLRGPEEDSEIQDSVCEEPEILESERPRPQGSSPIEEFPAEKQTEEDPYDLPHKGGSIKKSKKIGFGGLLDKRTPAKMNETESDSEMIVTAVKETYTKGLVVTGGKKDGIFIREVKPDSPASKLLSVKEGDQILSATIYFDNVSHEDALHILEHAQPYKMEFCLKRRVISTVPKPAETALSEGKDGGSPKMRGQRRMKKQQDRISWPKFPSFGKGHKAQFRRSHSTSEAEEQRKLEISPPTSDAESPFKSPLKSPDLKDKRKKHKVKLKMKMKGHRSKSEEEPHKTEKEPASEVLVVLENQDGEVVLEENVSDEFVKKSEYEVASKIENEQTLPSLSEIEGQHEVNLISLGNTLKTTNIPVALLEREKTECSEMKLRINEGEIFEVETENQSLLPEHRTFEPSTFDSIIPQTAKETPQLDTDSSKQEKDKDSTDKNLEYKNVELSIPTFSDVEEEKKSLTIGSEKQQKEKNIHENASYGIRTRGPLAGMATSKTHFINTLNGLQFMSPDTGCDVTTEDSHLKLKTSDAISANLDKTFELKFRLPNIDLSAFENHETIKMTETETIKTRLPKREEIEIPGMEAKELKQNIPEIKVQNIEKIINITKKREIQDSQIKEEFNVRDVKEAVSKFPAFKLPERDITGVLVQREIKIMEMKADKSNLTPKGSPSKILITSTPSSTTITESKIGKEISSPSAAVGNENAMTIPKVDLPYIDDQIITDTHINYKKPTRKTQVEPDKMLKTDDRELIDVNFKLPKREDIEIPGMEAIKECNVQNTEDKTAKDTALYQVPEQSGDIRSSLLLQQENVYTVIKSDAEKGKKPKTKKHGDIKGQEKKSKRPKTTLSSTGIPKPEFAFPESGIVLEVKEDSSKKDEAAIKTIGETKIITDKQIKTSEIRLPKNLVSDPNKSVNVGQEINVLEDNPPLPEEGVKEAKADQTVRDTTKEKVFSPTKFKIPSITLPQFGAKTSKAAIDVSPMDVQFKDTEISSHKEQKLPTEPPSFCTEKHVNKDVSVKPKDTEDIQDKKFKLPKFEISFPEVKAPKITLGVSKKESEAEVSPQNVDISLPEGSENVKGANTNIEMSKDDSDQKDFKKFGSPSRFKLPSISFPKFGAKSSKVAAEASEMDLGEIKRPEINVPETEVELSADPVLADVHKKTKPVSVEIKDQKIQSESIDSTFKMPKFGIRLPEVKGPKIDLGFKKAETEISVPEGKVEVHPPDVNKPDVTAEVKADLPEIDSKCLEVKIKKPGFTLPTTGLGKSEIKAPVVDSSLTLPNADVTVPEAGIEMEIPNTDIKLSEKDTGQKESTKFGSPTKFKLPSISLPKIGVRLPKATVEVSDVDVDVKGPEINVPDAEPKLSIDPLSVKIKGPDVNKEAKALNVEIKEQDIPIKDQESTFNIPKFGIRLPEVKGPKIDLRFKKAETDISVPEGKIEVHPLEVNKPDVTAEVKADLPEIDSKGLDINIKRPGFTFPSIGFGKSEIKAPVVDVTLPNADATLPEAKIEMEIPNTDIKLSKEDSGQKDSTKFGSPTKFKLPSISFPKIGVKLPTAKVEVSNVDVDVKGPEINLPDAEPKLSIDPLSVEIKRPDVDKEANDLSVEIKEQDIPIKGQDSTFNIPKFGIRLPEVKGPKIDVSFKKAETYISVPEGKVEVHPPDVIKPDVTAEVKADLPEIDSKGLDIKIKKPGFTFPSIGFGKSEMKAPEVDVTLPNADVSLPEASIEMEGPHTDIQLSKEDSGQKDSTKFGSPTKFKLPSISLPKIGVKLPKAKVEVSDVDVDVKGPEINVPDAEPKLSVKPLSVEIKGPDVDKEANDLSVEIKEQDIPIKGQDSTFNLPKFGIRLPEMKGPKIDLSFKKADTKISVPEGKVEVHPPEVNKPDVTAEVKADLPEIDSKGVDIKIKRPGFTFPSIGFGKSEIKAPEVDVTLPNADVSLPEASIAIEGPHTDIKLSKEDSGQKDSTKFGSPTKFKLPSISLPKIGVKLPKAKVEVSDVDVDVKGPEINVPDAEPKLSIEPLSVDVSLPEASIEMEGPNTDIKLSKKDSGQKESTKFGSPTKFKLPSISLPKIGVKLPKAKVEVSDVDVDVKGPEINVLDAEPKLSIEPLSVDVSLPEASIEMEGPNTDIKLSKKDSGQKDSTKFGSPTKFKLPSISLPKIGVKLPKAKVEVSDVDVDVKGPEINVPDAEPKLSIEPLSVDVSLPEASIEMEGPNTDIKLSKKDSGQKDSTKFGSPTKFKLPSISLPKIGVKLPKAKVEVSDVDVDVKGPEINVPDAEPKLSIEPLSVDVSLPEASIEMEGPNTDIKLSKKYSGQKDSTKFGSPTKFKLPSISLPKIGVKLPKAKVEVSDVDVDVKKPEINVPDAEPKLSTDPLSVKIKGPDVDKEAKALNVEIKEQDIPIKGQESTFSIPKFGIRLPEVKGPKIDLSFKKAETEISVPEGKVEVHPPEVNKPDVTAEVKADLPEIDSKGLDINIKKPGFTFPSIGFGKSEMKAPEVDVTLPNADVSLPEASIEMEGPHTDIQLSKEDSGQKDSTRFGSPTKFKLPSISLPKIGVKLPKAKVEVSDVDVDVKRPEINVPDAEPKLSIEPLSVDVSLPEASIEMEGLHSDIKLSKEDSGQKESTKFGSPTKFKLPSISFPKIGVKLPKAKVDVSDVDVDVKKPEINVPDAESKLSIDPLSVKIKGPDVDKEANDLSVEIKEQDIPIKGQESTFNIPKYGIKLPEVKGPKIDLSFKKAETEMSVPEGKVEVHPPDFNKPDVTAEVKADLPEIDSKGLDIKIKRPGFTFPSIGFGKSEMKAPEVDVTLPNADVSLPEASIEMEGPHTDIQLSKEDSGQKNSTKFGSPTKFKLPSISLPKIGVKLPTAKVEVSDVDVDVKGPEINLPDAEPKLSIKPLSVEIKGPDVDKEAKALNMEIKEQDISIKGQDSTFNLPKFGIRLPEVKGPKIDFSLKKAETEISVPEGKVEVHPPEVNKPDVTAEVKADLPEIDSKCLDIKIKRPGFTFPSIGFGKSEIKAPEVDVTLPNADVSLPEAKIEMERPHTDIHLSKEDSGQKDSTRFGSPTKFKLPSISLPKIGVKLPKAKVEVSDVDVDVKGPEINVPDAEPKLSIEPLSVDVSLPEASIEMEGPNTDIKLSKEGSGQKESTKFGSPTKFKLPSISFPKFGTKAPKAKVEVSDVDVEGPEINVPDAEPKLSVEPLSVEIKGPDVDKEAKALNVEIKEQGILIKGQESTFNLPKFGIRLPEVKGPKIDFSFKKAETEIGKSEIKAPEVDATLPNADVSLPEAGIEMEIPDTDIQLSKEDSGQKDSTKFGSPTKFKLPSISLPKIGVKLPKAKVEVSDVDVDVKGPEINVPDAEPKLSIDPLSVDVTLPEASIEMEGPNTDIKLSKKDSGQKDSTKFGSPTKFKLPSISFPKFGTKASKTKVEVSDMDVEGPEINVPDAKLQLPSEQLSVAIKGPDMNKEAKSVSVEIKDQDFKTEGEDSTFKLPKFEFSLPEIKGPKIDFQKKGSKEGTNVSVSMGKVDVYPPDVNVTAEVKADIPEMDSKAFEVKMKRPGFTFPTFGSGKSEIQAAEADLNLPKVDVSLLEASAEIDGQNTDLTLSKKDSGQKDSAKFGSPTKFKLPSISFPKFGTKASKPKAEVSDVDVDVKGPEINVPDAELKLPAKSLSVDIKEPDVDKEAKSVSVEIKDQDFQIEGKDSTFKLPKFGISLPEIKGPKIDFSKKKADIEISALEGMVEIHQPTVNVQDVKAEVKANCPEVSLPEASIEIKEQNADNKLSKEGQKDSTKFGSPTKFKLPSISLPKFGAKVPKLSSEVSDVDVDVKKTEKGLPDAEPEADVILPSVDVSLPEGSQQQSKKESKQKDSKFGSPTKFKLPSISFPKFGAKVTKVTAEEPERPDAEIKLTTEPIKEQDILITGQESLLEVKGPTTDLGSDMIEAKISEMHPSDVKVQDITTEVKADLPEVDSKVPGVKVKMSGFSLPKFGFSKSESSEADASLQNVNVSLPQESAEIEEPNTEDVGQKASGKFDSPTKFKLPSIKFPKFELQVTKETVDKSSVEVDVKPPEISDSELKLSAQPLDQTVDIKLSNVDLKGTTQLPDERDHDVEINNKVETSEMAKISISTSKSQYRDQDSFMSGNVPGVTLEQKSPKTLLPSFGDIVKAFDVEFYIPTLDEIEEAKKYTSESLKLEYDSGISQPSVYGNEGVNLDITTEKKEKQTEDKLNKNIVFEFSSTTVKVDGKETFQPPNTAEESPINDLNDKDAEQSSTREVEVDSPTLSLRSSDAFADVSSAPITEQITSPTKVKVKYSESTAAAEVSDVHSEVFTLTARTELITIVPHQPEKVNIPFSSEASSSSLDTLKEMSGKMHIIKNYVQSESDTAILTNTDTQNIQTLFSKSVAESVLSVEKTTVQKERTLVEKHVVKEMFGDDEDSPLVMQKIQIFEGAPILDDTTYSIKKLRDTVHSEKMRFFESGESSKTIVVSTETKILKRADFSKEESEEK
ncbi:neuroblast differentiation-associated protein AHNAK-like [Trichomycterus rosablanca]|uniref:neuroblast differentiation-associated protein AHNAK-like n=1 Tax=Trichomycterus rosablanca TaxID=2290929 RepID=UPI002F3582FA